MIPVVPMNVVSSLLLSLVQVIDLALELYIWVLIIGAVLSWLVAFGVVNRYNRFVQVVGDFITRITEPVLRPIRRIVPPLGGVDLSGLVLIFIIIFIRIFLARLFYI
jgi:YggT family protein